MDSTINYSRKATNNDLFGTSTKNTEHDNVNKTFNQKNQQHFGERKRIKP